MVTKVKTQKKMFRNVVGIVMMLLLFSCQEWGLMDPPAGGQKNPLPEPPKDKSAKLVARYTFENNVVNTLDANQVGERLAQASGTAPTFEENAAIGSTVLHQYFGFNDASTISYAKFPNPLQNAEELYGASISLWVNRIDDNVWDAIWSFLDEDNSDGIDGRYYLTPNAYLGFNGTGGWFDLNHPGTVTNAIPVGEWTMLTVTMDMEGFAIYLNGKMEYNVNKINTWADVGGVTPPEWQYVNVVNLIQSCKDFYLGYGSWWGSADLLIDDLLIYKNALTATEVAALYDSYSGLVAYYNFDSNVINVVNTDQWGELKAQDSGTIPTYEQDATSWGSTFLHTYFGFPAGASTSYVQFSNPLKDMDIMGATISIWVNRLDAGNPWDGIWSFFDEDNTDGVDGRVYLQPNAYLGFNGTGGWFDANHPDDISGAVLVEPNVWNMVTVTFAADNFGIYVNGVKIADKTRQNGWRSLDNIASADFDYDKIINLVKSSAYFYIGYGSWWGSAPLYIDDLMIYKRVLSDTEISNLFNSNTNVIH